MWPGLVDQCHAEGAESGDQALGNQPEDSANDHHRKQDAGRPPHAAIEVLAVDESFEAGNADVHGAA